MSRQKTALFCALFVATTCGAFATSARADGEQYEVKPGDYLKGIATKLGVTVPDLLAANDLRITSVIHAGDRLVVPPGGKLPAAVPPAPAAHVPAPTTPYVVATGDYFISIAAKHGVTVGALLSANALKITSTIQPGQTLAIPPRTIPVVEPASASPAAMAAPAATAAASAPLDTVLAYLQAQVGKPYKFYTAGPDSFDCSGLVRAAYLQVGIKLPHYSLLQSKQGVAVDWTAEAIRPGDLVFTISSSSPNEIGHVGIAIDSRRWIQAAGTGDAVRIGPMPKPTSIRAVRRVL